MTDFGKPGYGGPYPPEGGDFHQYLVTGYALKTDHLGLENTASPPLLATTGFACITGSGPQRARRGSVLKLLHK